MPVKQPTKFELEINLKTTTALGLTIHSENVLAGLTASLRDKQMLIVLDSCEHVIDAAASLVEQILVGASGVRILATSREPLRAKAERVHRLSPLASPPSASGLTATEALAFPAVQLFVERAAESLENFELNDADAPVVAEICRKLEGIALAIELAATRIDAFGVRDLSVFLNDRFRLLRHGRRTALSRHRTLAAALDWSYEFLPEVERTILRRLSVFVGAFTLHSASAVIAEAEILGPEVVESFANLVAKSLVSADVGGAVAQYRLLDTTRGYALEKLTESGEHGTLARRHAEYFRDVFEQAEAEWETRPAAKWLADYGPQIENLRAALDWAFSPHGNTSIGVALTATALPLWMHLSLLGECRIRVEQALAALTAGSERDTRREMKLYAALGASLINTRGATGPEIGAAWTKALEIAENLDDAEYQLRSL